MTVLAPRRLLLLVDLTAPEGVVPAGTTIVVEAAEARIMLGAIGLAEDLGEVDLDTLLQELEARSTNSSGEGADGSTAPGGPVPSPRTDGASAPPVPANAVAGDDTLPSAAPGGGDAATGAAPVSDTLPGGATPDSAGASPVDAAKAHDAAEAPGAAAPPPSGGGAPGGAAPAGAAAPATRRAKRS